MRFTMSWMKPHTHQALRKLGLLSRTLVPALAAVFLGGCVERILTVRTEPEGARVFLDGQEVGESPCDVPFEHFGTRDVEVRLIGHRARREFVEIDPPWWQYTPFDFFAEVIDPRDHVFRYDVFMKLELSRGGPEEEDELLRRAEEMRSLARSDSR